MFRLLTKGVMRGGPRRLGHFLRSVPWFTSKKIPLAIVDWIAALSMRHLVEQHFTGSTETQHAKLGEYAERLRAQFAPTPRKVRPPSRSTASPPRCRT